MGEQLRTKLSYLISAPTLPTLHISGTKRKRAASTDSECSECDIPESHSECSDDIPESRAASPPASVLKTTGKTVELLKKATPASQDCDDCLCGGLCRQLVA